MVSPSRVLWQGAGMELMVGVPGGEVWAEHVAGDGVPVVLLHPGLGDSRIWDPVVDRLSGRRVIRYDVRGFGRSPQPTVPYSLEADLAAVLDQFELERVVLVGCSMGGSTAINLALSDPDRVAALVLLCPGVTGYPRPDEPELDAEYEALVRADDVEGLVQLGLRLWGGAGADEAVAAQLRAAVPAWSTQGTYQRADPPAYDRLGELRMPSVLMVGDRDRSIVAACGGAVAARIPGCRFSWLPGVDHFPPLRAPELVAAAILEYCDRPPEARPSPD